MVRGMLSGLMIGALVLVAVGGRGYAAETIIKADAPIKGEGRFYKIGDNQLLFSGYFQGNVEAEQGDLHEAGLVCPGLMEVNRTTGTQQGEGRCIIRTKGGDFLSARWTCTGKAGRHDRICAASSRPPMSGMMRSVTTRSSGSSVRLSRCSASTPLRDSSTV